jgi:hypothetical protein
MEFTSEQQSNLVELTATDVEQLFSQLGDRSESPRPDSFTFGNRLYPFAPGSHAEEAVYYKIVGLDLEDPQKLWISTFTSSLAENELEAILLRYKWNGKRKSLTKRI